MVHARGRGTVVVVSFAVPPREPERTRARERVDVVTAGSSVLDGEGMGWDQIRTMTIERIESSSPSPVVILKSTHERVHVVAFQTKNN